MANEFGMQYPTEIFLALLGLPTSDGLMFLKWVEDIFGGFFGGRRPLLRQGRRRAHPGYFRVALADVRRARAIPKRTWSPGCSLRASTTSRFRTKTCSRSV